MNHDEFVLGALEYYAENYYEPGNPEDGEWHDCHYPVPRCLGGVETIKLLKQHHAIQGVLQSEEYQYPCIFGWEKDYLPEELRRIFDHWSSEKPKVFWRTATEDEKEKLRKRRSEFRLGVPSGRAKRVRFCDQRGEVRFYPSLKECSRDTLIDYRTLKHMVKGTSFKKYSEIKVEWADNRT